MNFGEIIGAVLNGAMRPRGTVRRGTGPFGMTQTETRQVGRVLGSLATIAADALAKSGSSAPAEAPPVRGQGRPIPDITPAGSPWRLPPESAPATPPSPPQSAPQAPASSPAPAPADAEAAEARLLLRAMIAAARADGTVDKAERATIAARLDTAGLSPEERDHVLADFDHPASIGELAGAARDPMLAAQLYAAAFSAAGALDEPERVWLDQFGKALKLDRAALAAIEQRLGG
jgi:pyruvate/2-oxoglutarate dehydrogenase complex dihydrolipoamide acyltransferase (E2) component